MDLCLGTAQFGMDYGIQGGRKPAKDNIFEILDCAAENDIKTLDTAWSYGDAEKIIGEYRRNTTNCHFEVISKLSVDLYKNLSTSEYMDFAQWNIEKSLSDLNIPRLKGLLFHNPAYLYNEAALDTLRCLKQYGYTEGIGVSVYRPEDAWYAVQLGMDIIQVPANLFDRRFDSLIEEAGSRIKIYTRSIFLQGLLLMNPTEVSQKLPQAAEDISRFDNLCRDFHITRCAAAYSYLKKKTGINSLVFGVDNRLQLEENISAYGKTIPDCIICRIAEQFEQVRPDIISPVGWNINKSAKIEC